MESLQILIDFKCRKFEVDVKLLRAKPLLGKLVSMRFQPMET